jgi:predicted Zn-dependent protease
MQASAGAAPAEASEPPLLGAGAVLALADMQLRADQAAAAEQTLRAELIVWPDNGWALRALRKAAVAQGRAAEAAQLDAQIALRWPEADRSLR